MTLLQFSLFIHIGNQIRPCCKIGQGQPRVINYTNFIELEPNFNILLLVVLEKEIFEGCTALLGFPYILSPNSKTIQYKIHQTCLILMNNFYMFTNSIKYYIPYYHAVVNKWLNYHTQQLMSEVATVHYEYKTLF